MAGTAVQRRLSWRLGEVVGLVEKTPRVRTLVVTVPGWPGHRAGQHVDVRLTAEDGYQTQHSYSISSPPEDGQRVSLTVERLDDGEVSPYLVDEVRVGDRLELRGPIGGYFVWEAETTDPLQLVAGGSGVCPLMAMLRHRAAAPSRVPTRLLYSSRSLEDLIYRAELDGLAAADGGPQVTYTLTRERPPGWTGFARRIDRQMLAEAAWPPERRPLVFVCGPTSFVESAADHLVALGHEAARIKTERFGPSG